MKKPRLRFSLMTVLLLGTIAAMAVTMWRNGKDLVPLRAELMDLRSELGYFRVDQPDRIAIQESDVVTSKAWRWRLYLPRNKSYFLNYRIGFWRDIDLNNKPIWLRSLKGSGSSGTLPEGQFTLNVSLENFDGKWFLRYAYANELQGTMELNSESKWLKNLLLHDCTSEAQVSEIRQFDASEPLILLHVRQNEIQEEPQGSVVNRTTGTANSFVLWISAQ